MYLDGGLANQKIYYKSYCKQKKNKLKTKGKKKIQAVQGNCHRQQNLSSLRSEPQSNTEPGFLCFFFIDAVITNI